MKAIILAGGLGTRISEETQNKPKPMIEIGSKPIIWHIMKLYSYHGINDFIICCGYKGYLIKEYFANYYLHDCDLEIDVQKNNIKLLNKKNETWKITLVDTGENTMTGGRLKRIKKFLEEDEDFCFTYGDGLSDVNIKSLIQFHKKKKTLATLTSVLPPGRYGNIKIIKDKVVSFKEKPKGDGARINGGFFVLSPRVFNLIKDDRTVWEEGPLEKLAKKNQLSSFRHNGFWQPMDTLRDKNYLDELWKNKKAPWKIWK